MENFMQNPACCSRDMEKIPTMIHVNANHNNFRGSNTWTSRAEPNYTVPFVINYHRQAHPEAFQAIPTKTYVNPLMLPSKTVLVNPHFKRNVHVNPHFNKPVLEIESTSASNKPPAIYINPKAYEKFRSDEKSKPIETVVLTKKSETDFDACLNIHRTRRRLSIRTKYKIVRSGTIVKSPVLKSMYKIDRRVAPPKRPAVLRTVSKRKIVHRHTRPIPTVRRKFSYVMKYEPSKLYRACVKRPLMSSLRTVRHRYAVDRRRKISRKSISDDKLNQTPKRRSKSLLSTGRRLVVNSKRKFITKKIVQPMKGTRKDNTLCPFYRKYGSCRGKENGTCHKLHDQKHVTVCKKFLRGACNSENCHLSHDVSLKKMPTCKFFLDGFCGKDNCPYLHVKLNPKTEICKAFLQGYCDAAEQCDKRHVSVCPVLDKEGVCNDQKCPYPHTVKPVEIGVPLATKPKPEPENLSAKPVEPACVKDKTKEQSTGPLTLSRYHNVTEYDQGEKPHGKFTKTKLPETLPDFIPLA